MLRFNRILAVLLIVAATVELSRSKAVNPSRTEASGITPCVQPWGGAVAGTSQSNAPCIPNAWARPLNTSTMREGWQPLVDPHRRQIEDSNEIPPSTPILPLKRDFERLVLVQGWRRAACSKFNNNAKLVDANCQSCGITGECNDWSLHGLWPSGQIGDSPPEFCESAERFNSKNLKSSLRKSMQENWRNVFHGYSDNEMFWKKEWDKHGTCAAQLPWLNGIPEYFGKTLDLYSNFKVKTLLKRSNIQPNVVAPRLVTDFHEALYKQLNNHTAKITCVNGTDTQGGTTLLIHEVHICFSKYLKLEDCPNGYHHSCGMDKIKYY